MWSTGQPSGSALSPPSAGSSAAAIHLVVVESPPSMSSSSSTATGLPSGASAAVGSTYDDGSSAADLCGYDWGLTYKRLRRASAMIGASAVAIDNKIEQAMDLVKSHLMFAVREEVELLKEQIKELTERNGQLELENTILRAAASPETLALLQSRPAPPT